MDIELIRKTILFQGMSLQETETALRTLKAQEKRYIKGDTVLFAGNTTERMGLVLKGSVTIESNDMWGNRTILSHVGKGQFFAETYAFLGNEPMLVDVTANEDCHILFLLAGRLKQLNNSMEPWALKYAANLLTISAHKNLTLSGRSFHTAPKTIRGRLMSYLYAQSVQQGRTEFSIPFDRQQMADYLNVERTALSKELGKMKRDGILDYRKNRFRLIGELNP